MDKRLPIPDLRELFWTFVGAFLSILAISAVNHFQGLDEHILYLVGSFGASAVLLFGVTESKLAQPRNVSPERRGEGGGIRVICNQGGVRGRVLERRGSHGTRVGGSPVRAAVVGLDRMRQCGVGRHAPYDRP